MMTVCGSSRTAGESGVSPQLCVCRSRQDSSLFFLVDMWRACEPVPGGAVKRRAIFRLSPRHPAAYTFLGSREGDEACLRLRI